MDKRFDIIATAAKVISETVRDMAAAEKTGPEKPGPVGPDRDGPGGRERAGELGQVRECKQASEQTNKYDPSKEGETDCPKEGAADCPKEGRSSFPKVSLDAGLYFDYDKKIGKVEAEYRKNRLKPQNWSESLRRDRITIRMTTPFYDKVVSPTRNERVRITQYRAGGNFESEHMKWPCDIFKCQYSVLGDITHPFLTIIAAVAVLKNDTLESDYYSYDVFDGDHPSVNKLGDIIPTGFISGIHAPRWLPVSDTFNLLCINQH